MTKLGQINVLLSLNLYTKRQKKESSNFVKLYIWYGNGYGETLGFGWKKIVNLLSKIFEMWHTRNDMWEISDYYFALLQTYINKNRIRKVLKMRFKILKIIVIANGKNVFNLFEALWEMRFFERIFLDLVSTSGEI